MIRRLASVAATGFALFSFMLAAPAFADWLITDQIGRQVHLPDSVNRVVLL